MSTAISLWQSVLDDFIVRGGNRTPKNSWQLLKYGMAFCEAWKSAVVDYMFVNLEVLSADRLREWASVCYVKTTEEMVKFGHLDLAGPLRGFSAWFDQFFIGALTTKRREVKRALNFLDEILKAKCQLADSEFCYNWVLNYKTVQEVCDFLRQDDANELLTVKAQNTLSGYMLLKSKMAMDYHMSLELVRTFEAKIGEYLAAAGGFPNDLTLEHLSDQLKLQKESDRILDQVGLTSELLKGRVLEVLEGVRLRFAQENIKLVHDAELSVAAALLDLQSSKRV